MSKITITNIIVDDVNKCKWLVDGVCNNPNSSRYNHMEGSKECIEGNYKCFEKEDGTVE